MNDIKVTTKNNITTITLNRPDVLNAIRTEMHTELQMAFDDFSQDENQLICIITGEGSRAFCVGSDLKNSNHGQYPKNGYGGITQRFDLNKPVIASVNGLALGGGFEIALACDLIIASDQASFGMPEPLVGYIPLGGGVQRLSRQIGQKQAMGLLLSSKTITASEAYSMGLINEVVPATNLMKATHQWCDNILKGAPLAIQATKEGVLKGFCEPNLELAIQAQNNLPAVQKWTRSHDRQEGINAFTQKRSPVWSGR